MIYIFGVCTHSTVFSTVCTETTCPPTPSWSGPRNFLSQRGPFRSSHPASPHRFPSQQLPAAADPMFPWSAGVKLGAATQPRLKDNLSAPSEHTIFWKGVKPVLLGVWGFCSVLDLGVFFCRFSGNHGPQPGLPLDSPRGVGGEQWRAASMLPFFFWPALWTPPPGGL